MQTFLRNVNIFKQSTVERVRRGWAGGLSWYLQRTVRIVTWLTHPPHLLRSLECKDFNRRENIAKLDIFGSLFNFNLCCSKVVVLKLGCRMLTLCGDSPG